MVFASKAFPCTAVLALFAQEGLWCDVASGGELHLALNAGFSPERIVLHGNAKSEDELRMALARGVGLIVLDNFDEIERLESLLAAGARGGRRRAAGARARHAGRARRDAREDLHRPGRLQVRLLDRAGRRGVRACAGADGLSLQGVHAHIGSQLLGLDPFRAEVAELAKLGDFAVWDLGGGLGVRYTRDQPAAPTIEDYVGALVRAAHAHDGGERRRLLIEPGRALCANAAVTLYTVQSVKQNVSRWVAVDGGMSDNLRPMLYGSLYEAQVADRFEGATRCRLAGKHCESGDVIVRDALLDDPKPGDVIVTPATGAYGFAMANNYNGVPRAPVIFCRDGDARVVLRRETFDDLTARDVD